MTKHEANAALCRALGVEGKRRGCMCDGQQCVHRDWCNAIVYPPMDCADVLMAALRKAEHQFKVSDCMAEVWRNGGEFAYATFRHGETHGSMLFRAACAAFGIECDV